MIKTILRFIPIWSAAKNPKNQALVLFRQDLIKFIQEYTEENCFSGMPTTNVQFHQWSLSVEV